MVRCGDGGDSADGMDNNDGEDGWRWCYSIDSRRKSMCEAFAESHRAMRDLEMVYLLLWQVQQCLQWELYHAQQHIGRHAVFVKHLHLY